ncbi:hypothetical protein ACIRPQ_13535 [Streptomyces sp. NPDC101213]|uniref:hypothetical protein n=1 Tax=Streptomyces sp. NPDC101213 TaxID=3366130 RepID=UPI00380BD9C0
MRVPATAGHAEHGKSTLVRVPTGEDTCARLFTVSGTRAAEGAEYSGGARTNPSARSAFGG